MKTEQQPATTTLKTIQPSNVVKITKKKKKTKVKRKATETVEEFFNKHASTTKWTDSPGQCFFSKCNVKGMKSGASSNTTPQQGKLGWGTTRWAAKPIVCRCELCELKAVIKQSAKRCKTFVLLDLDCWGWSQWGKYNIEYKEQWNSSEIFVWAFYGSGFLGIHQGKELEESMREQEIFDQLENRILRQADKPATQNAATRQLTVFEQLAQKNLLRFSPVGGTSQAGDLAIRKLCKLLIQKVNVCVITSDIDLAAECGRVVSSVAEQERKGHRFASFKPLVVRRQILSKVEEFHNNTLEASETYQYIN